MPSSVASSRLAATLKLGTILAAAAVFLAPSTRAALAQATTTLETISVEGSGGGAPGAVPGGGNGGATSGGGGGPSGVTGYTARISPVATKTNTPLIETPQSVSVVTREQLNDRNVQDINQAIAYVPGVSSNVFGFDPRYDAFYIRGFDATYNGIYRDGLRLQSVGIVIPRTEPYGVEALTVLRGPASGLYGLGSPGGIVDATSKRPLFTPFGEIQLQAGNYSRYQGNVDLGGPVEGSDGTMAWRVTGVKRQSDTFLPGGNDDRGVIAPSFTWRPDADTSFTFLSEYFESRLPGTAFYYNDPGFRVTRIYSGDPAFNNQRQQQYRIGYAFEHRFSPDLIFRQNFRYLNADNDSEYVYLYALNAARTAGSRIFGLYNDRIGEIVLDNQLEAHVETGPVRHTIVAGLDYSHYDYARRYATGLAPDLDLVTRNYGQQAIARPAFTNFERQAQDQVGVYLQDQARLGRFVLTLTGRHDWVFQDTANLNTASRTNQTDTAFSGRVGLNYLLSDAMVPYASYATTFTPQPGVDAAGNPFKPATGEQIEAGVKVAVPGLPITGAVAGFDITQSSILRQDPGNVNNQVATGAVNSRGFEMEATANLAPGTNLTLAYTHLQLRYVRQSAYDQAGNVVAVDGNFISGIPGDTFTAFATYLFPNVSALAGLQLGGGVRFAGTSFADDLNTVRNPTVTLWDALISYDFAALDPSLRGFRAQVNGYNVLDRRYTNCQAGFCYRGAPATVIGSLIYRW